MRIKPFRLLHNALKQIVQQRIGNFQAFLKAQMKQAVTGIHAIVVRRVFCPNQIRLYRMEIVGVFQKEHLHIRYLHKSLIIGRQFLIPNHRPALFHCRVNSVHLNNMILDFRHQYCQENFINTGKNFCVRYVFHV